MSLPLLSTTLRGFCCLFQQLTLESRTKNQHTRNVINGLEHPCFMGIKPKRKWKRSNCDHLVRQGSFKPLLFNHDKPNAGCTMHAVGIGSAKGKFINIPPEQGGRMQTNVSQQWYHRQYGGNCTKSLGVVRLLRAAGRKGELQQRSVPRAADTVSSIINTTSPWRRENHAKHDLMLSDWLVNTSDVLTARISLPCKTRHKHLFCHYFKE